MSYTREILDLCHEANFKVPLFLLFVSGLGVPGPVAGQLVRISRRVWPSGQTVQASESGPRLVQSANIYQTLSFVLSLC